jgi:hypothetical protein
MHLSEDLHVGAEGVGMILQMVDEHFTREGVEVAVVDVLLTASETQRHECHQERTEADMFVEISLCIHISDEFLQVVCS